MLAGEENFRRKRLRKCTTTAGDNPSVHKPKRMFLCIVWLFCFCTWLTNKRDRRGRPWSRAGWCSPVSYRNGHGCMPACMRTSWTVQQSCCRRWSRRFQFHFPYYVVLRFLPDSYFVCMGKFARLWFCEPDCLVIVFFPFLKNRGS
jgi:hypothetical protein